MANLFIGFPVPRARIADMIEGSAPPIIHHENHESGGEDEINATGLVGAGGAAFPFDGISVGGSWEDYLGYEHVGAEGSEICVNDYGLCLHWQSGTTGTLMARRRLKNGDAGLAWTKAQRLDLSLRVWCAGTSANTVYAIRGRQGSAGFGFISEDGELIGVMGCVDGDYAEVGLLTAAEFNGHAKILSARLDPTTYTCTFFVNGVEINHITSELSYPTETTYIDEMFYIDLFADNLNNYATCGYWNFWQEL